jgi:hypothetical protein
MSLFINYDFSSSSQINTPDGKKILNSIPNNTGVYDANNYGCTLGSIGINNIPTAISFISTNSQYIQIPQFNLSSSGLTIAFWLKVNNSLNGSKIIDFGNGNSNNNIICFINGQNLGFCVYMNSTIYTLPNSIPNLTNNTWNHIVWTLSNPTGWNIYINGINQNVAFNGPYPNILFRNFNYIGKSNDNSPYFSGSIQDFRIYNDVLSDIDISAIYNKYKNNNTNNSIVFNDLYNEIYCNINSPPYRNGYKTITGKAFNDDLNVLNTSTTTSETDCLDICYKNPNCTSYKYNTTTKQNNCTLYNTFPTNTVDATNINSGYSITKFNFPFTSLNSDQKTHVKDYCMKKYLVNKYPDTKNILDDPNFLNINDNGNNTVIDISAQNLYDKYNSLGITSMSTVSNSTFTPSDPRSSTDAKLLSTNDSVLDNYGTTYKRYSDNITTIKNNNSQAIPTQNDINYLNNTVSPRNNTYYNQFSSSVNNIENFESEIKKKKIVGLIILLFLMFLIIYFLKII